MPTAVSAQTGVCVVCGCTDNHACPGGCAWANDQHTLCSRCAEGPRLEELEPADELDLFMMALRKVGMIQNEIERNGLEVHLLMTFIKAKGLLDEYLVFSEAAMGEINR